MNDSLPFFERTFYGNTVWDWALALLIIIGAVVVARTVYWVFKKLTRKFTQKSTTNFDDLVVDMVEEPIAFAIVLFGIWYALHNQLQLSETASNWVSKAYYVLIIFNVAWLLSRLFDAIVREYVQPLVEKTEGELDDQLLPIVRKGVRIAIWVLAVLVALNNAGYDVGALLAGLGIGGLAFALAAQDTVSNLFGGFTIFVDKPFSINDRIEVNGLDGFVTEIGIRSTRLRTLGGRMIVIPNSKVANNAITNISSEPSRKVALELGLTYDTPPEKMELAMELLKKIGEEQHSIIEEETLISFNKFGDFSLGILFIYFIRKESDILGTMSTMNMAILKRFNENGLDFAFPSQTIYTKEG